MHLQRLNSLDKNFSLGTTKLRRSSRLRMDARIILPKTEETLVLMENLKRKLRNGATTAKDHYRHVFLFALVLLSVSQAMIASVNAIPVNYHDRDRDSDDHSFVPSPTPSCTQYLNVADPQQAMLYNELLSGQAVSNSTSLCVP